MTRLTTHCVPSTRYHVEGFPLVTPGMVEKHGQKNGNIFGCELRGVL